MGWSAGNLTMKLLGPIAGVVVGLLVAACLPLPTATPVPGSPTDIPTSTPTSTPVPTPTFTPPPPLRRQCQRLLGSRSRSSCGNGTLSGAADSNAHPYCRANSEPDGPADSDSYTVPDPDACSHFYAYS